MKISDKKMAPRPDSLVIDYKRKKVSGRFTITGFEDNGHHIAYVASLNLSGYGNSPKEAFQMLLDIVVDDFFHNLVRLPEHEVSTELEKLGWKKNRILRKRFSSESYIDREGILRNFNLSPETIISEQLLEV